jgi:hypothetical protein
MPEHPPGQLPEQVSGAGAPQGLAWSWELDLGALLDGIAAAGLGEPDDPHDLAGDGQAGEPGTGVPVTAGVLAGRVAEHLTPGPGLAGWLCQVPAAELSDYDLAASAGSWRRLASWAQARELAAVAQIASRTAARDQDIGVAADGRPARVSASAAAEVAQELAMSQFSAAGWADLAVDLAWRLAATGTALAAGQIDLYRARLIAEATAVLDDAAARVVEARVLPAAGRQTTGMLRAALRRAVIIADPQGAERRREQAERQAKVVVYPDQDSTATLVGQHLPAVHAAAAMALISAQARAMKAAGAPGPLDLLRAQVFLGRLLGTLPPTPPAHDAPPDRPPPDDDGPGDPCDPRDHGPGDPDDDGPGHSDGGPGPGDGDPRDPGVGNGPGGRNGDNPGGRDGGPPRGWPPRGGPGNDGYGRPRSRPDSRPDSGRGGSADGDCPGNDDPGRLDNGAPGDSGPADRPSPGSRRDDSPQGDAASNGNPRDGTPGRRAPGNATPDDGIAGDDLPGGDVLNGVPPPGDADAPGDDALGDEEDYPCPDGPGGHDDDDDGWRYGGPAPQWPDLPAAIPARSARLANGRPAPGLLDLSVPWATLAGTSQAPGHLGRIGPVTATRTRTLASSAASDPATEWRIIVTNTAGRAITVTRVPGPRGRDRPPSGSRAGGAGPAPTPAARTGLVARVTLTIPEDLLPPDASPPRPTPAETPAGLGPPGGILARARKAAATAAQRARAAAAADTAAGGCAHAAASPGYRPPPRLREQVIARDVTCRSPACRQPAWRGDLDHTRPYDNGGITCHCNLGGVCRTHHVIKHSPGWKLEQSTPGTFTWTTPAGRTFTVTPDTHPL